MAQINYDFYNGTDVYNDGEIEERLLNYYRNGNQTQDDTDEFFYLTTHIRANILNWYPFNKNHEVLEIGSGCGTLTQMLCQKCKTVYSVEGSKRRAEITYERNKEFDNLLVYAAEFGKFPLEKKFDFVILIGVFEYAKMFFNVENPFLYFLKEIKKVLKDTGKVLIAIENRYGLKYWAGANEDHLSLPYVGFSEYGSYSVSTFGTVEMQKLIKSAGFEKYKFYYPFPDYKLPEVIYTEERLPCIEELKDLPIYLYGNHANFNIQDVYEGLLQNGQFGFFSNSYLIEFGGNPANLSPVIYAKELSYREKKYRTVTIQTDDYNFKKIALDNTAKEHLKNMEIIYNKMCTKNIPATHQSLNCNNELVIEFCSGKSVARYTLEKMQQEGIQGIKKELQQLQNFYSSISETKNFTNPMEEIFYELYPLQTQILKLSLLDGNASNIIKNNYGDYVFIDQEWMAEKELPLDYLMFYSILYLGKVCKLSSEETEKLLSLYHITETKQSVFLSISSGFYKNIINSNTKQKQNDLTENFNSFHVKEIGTSPVCYFDTGHGFHEGQKIYGTYKKERNYYTAEFHLPENVKSIRIDPALCGEKCLTFTNILVNDKNIAYKLYNIVDFNNKKLLVKKNPYIVFEAHTHNFKFAINFQKMTLEEMEEYLKTIN